MSTPSTRRLAAVMIADVAGYSRLMEQDEAGTHTRLLDIRAQVTDPIVRRHGGRIVRTVGDGLLVEFASAMSALVAAIEIQRTMQERNRGLAAGERIDHRIGINLGDILVDTNDIAGNGVNVAARLEAIAPPGGIAVSGTVRDQVRQDLGVTFVDAGEQRVKNISQPIRVFKVELGAPSSVRTRLQWARWTRWAAAAIGALALAASVHFGYQTLAPRARPAQSLVVLPFAAASDNPGAATLAASLTSQLTSAVSRVADLTVIAPTVAARFTAPRADIKQIGRELDVRYALAGRIESAGDRTRVAAHLVDTDTGASLWSTELDAPPSADGSAPIALIGRLSDSLRSAVRGAELKRLSASGEASTAYALALRAMADLQQATTVAQMRAVRAMYERALQLEPQYVPALVGYAYALAYETHHIDAGASREKLLARADAVSLQAVTLEPGNAEAWGTRANVLLFRAHVDAAAEAIQRGLKLNPYLSTLHSLRGQILLAQGRGEDALSAFDDGIALNPSSAAGGAQMHFRCRALLLLARYDAAIESCERGMAFGPEWPDFMLLAAAYALRGDARQATLAKTELLKLQPHFSIRWHQAIAGRDSGGALTRFDETLYKGLRSAGVPD